MRKEIVEQLAKFSEDQVRDERGRWTSSGGLTSGKVTSTRYERGKNSVTVTHDANSGKVTIKSSREGTKDRPALNASQTYNSPEESMGHLKHLKIAHKF